MPFRNVPNRHTPLRSAVPVCRSCFPARPGGTGVPLTWFRSHLTAQIYRHEPRKTLTCTHHKGRDWQAKSGHHRGVGWCLMAHSCWAIRNIGISSFRDTLSFPYLFFPPLSSKKPHRSEMHSWYLPSWEGWISNDILCCSTPFFTHLLLRLIDLSSSTHQWPSSSSSCWFFSQAPWALSILAKDPFPLCWRLLCSSTGAVPAPLHMAKRDSNVVQIELPCLQWEGGDWMELYPTSHGHGHFCSWNFRTFFFFLDSSKNTFYSLITQPFSVGFHYFLKAHCPFPKLLKELFSLVLLHSIQFQVFWHSGSSFWGQVAHAEFLFCS